MINFEDLANESGILKSIARLTTANTNYGDVVVAENERIKKSLIDIRSEYDKTRDQITAYSKSLDRSGDKLNSLAQATNQLVTAQKNQTLQLAQNQAVTDSNNKVIVQMQDRLKQLQKEYEKLDLSQKKDIQRKKEIERELTQTTRAVNGLSTATAGSSRAMKAAEGSTDALRKSTNDLRKQLDAIPNAYDKGTGRINQQNQAVVKLNAQYQQSITLLKKIESGQGNNRLNVGNYPKGGGGIGSALDLVGAGSLVTGAGAVAAMAEAGKAIIEVGAKYERLNLLTENALQNNKKAAAEANVIIRNFADHSPSDIEEVTVAFNRLVDIGIIPTKEQLVEISDIAIAKNKNVLDYVEAIADAQQGEFERLKEFSVDASKSGDKIIFTYRGVRTTVDNTTTAISNYLIELGKVPGVIGATDKLSKSFWGRWATIKDDIKGVANDIYQIMLPALNAVAGGFSAGLGVLKTYTAGLKEMYRIAGIKGAIAGFMGDPTLAIKLGQQAQSKQASAGTPELDKARKKQDEQNKANDAARKKADADEKYAKEASKREAEANRILTEKINNSKAANDQLLATNEAAQQDGLITERQFIADRQKITLAGIAERQQILKASGKAETDDYKKLAADKIEAETKFKRDSLKLSLTESKSDANKAIAGLGKDHEDGSLSDGDYAERKRGILVASLNEQKQILAQAGQSNSKLAKEIDEQLLEADRDYFKARLKVATDSWKSELTATKDGLKEIDQSTADEYEKELAKITQFYNRKRQAVRTDVTNKKITQDEGDKKIGLLDIGELRDQVKAAQVAYDKDQLNSNILVNSKIKDLEKYKSASGRTAREILSADEQIAALKKAREKDASDDKIALDKKLSDNAIDQSNKEDANDEENNKRKKARRQQLTELAIQVGQTLVDGLFDRQQQETSNKITELDKQKDFELQTVGDNEAAKAAIENKYAAQKKALMRQQAAADKEKAVFDILLNTSVGVSKALPDIPLAILVGALGAVELGLALSRQLPAYFAGKNIDGLGGDRYAGPAIAGERGRELWMSDGKATLLDKPSLINVGRDDVILPNRITERILRGDFAEGQAIAKRTAWQSREIELMAENRERYQIRQMAMAMGSGSPSAKALASALAAEIGKLPFNHTTFDARGVVEYVTQAQHRKVVAHNKSQLGRRS